MPGISQIAGKVRSALHRSDSTSSSSSDDVAPSPPSSPGPKQEGRGLHGKLAHSLQIIVQNSEKSESPGSNTIHNSAIAPTTHASKHAWIRDMFSEQELDRNYVMDRKTKEKKFEDMPIYVRIGMHLLFNQSYLSQTLLGEKRVDKLLKDQSFKQGQIYDREDPAIVQPHIQSFVETYEIDTSQLLQPDLNAYKTFNEFFARRLKPDARPIDAPHDPTIITSVADCRLTVWNNVTTATKVWVKGKHFSVPELLGDAKLAEEKFGANPSLAIFRLAPADYHRFHNVFTANRRDIRVIESNIPSASALTTPVGFVAIGALLVGSIGWTDRSEGYRAEKGDDIGWFQYGGSTVIIVFPSDHIKWDDDLADASEQGIEVQVRVGEHIGQAIGVAPG
ncbi:Phosphatidylserine decarboxylase [Rhizoctonia solani]|uniref:Phosphatidylserine decarboxylase n=1 Tax=Rhizoctonia solani TaxID=456999 RepID=A0A8H7M9S4_9AGAM|nr:Phosphatidylserine decarboxylase [Rhizoctonia solani]